MITSLDGTGPDSKANISLLPPDKQVGALVLARKATVDAAAAAAGPAAPDPAEVGLAQGDVRTTLESVTKGSISIGSLTSNFRQFFQPMGAPPPPAGTDLVDASPHVVAALPVVVNGAIVGAYSGSIEVTAADGDTVVVSFTHSTEGACAGTYDHQLVRDSVKVQEAALVSVVLRDGLVRDTIGALDRSSRIAADNGIDLEDLRDAATGAGVAHSLAIDTPGAVQIAQMLVQRLEALLAHPGAATRTWPNIDATRLGTKCMRHLDRRRGSRAHEGALRACPPGTAGGRVLWPSAACARAPAWRCMREGARVVLHMREGARVVLHARGCPCGAATER